jgi:hypothetical protein
MMEEIEHIPSSMVRGGIMLVRKTLSLLLAMAAFGCTTTVPTDTAGVSLRGRHIVEYDGPQIKAELGTRWASTHPGDEWLVIKLSMSATSGTRATVDRSDISIVTPDGRELPLIDTTDFWANFTSLTMALDYMDAWGPPTGRLDTSEIPCTEWFLTPPKVFEDRDFVNVYPRQWCSGPLVFRPPAGVQPGRWVLKIELEESSIRIPFELGT